MRAYLARQAAESKALRARNITIVKELKNGTRTAKELSVRHRLTVGAIRSLFAAAVGYPAPYSPRAAQSQSDYQRRSTTYLVKRARAIVAARKKGQTFGSLAIRFGVTPARIRMIHVVATRRHYVARLLKQREKLVWAK